jgi:hypothetical protein
VVVGFDFKWRSWKANVSKYMYVRIDYVSESASGSIDKVNTVDT